MKKNMQHRVGGGIKGKKWPIVLSLIGTAAITTGAGIGIGYGIFHIKNHYFEIPPNFSEMRADIHFHNVTENLLIDTAHMNCVRTSFHTSTGTYVTKFSIEGICTLTWPDREELDPADNYEIKADNLVGFDEITSGNLSAEQGRYFKVAMQGTIATNYEITEEYNGPDDSLSSLILNFGVEQNPPAPQILLEMVVDYDITI